MICYLKKVCELFKKFVRVQVKHVPRTENSWANTLAKLATASQEDLDRWVLVEHLMEPSINVNSDWVLLVITAPSWMDLIWDYLLNGISSSDQNEASKLRARSVRFSFLRGTLYKQGFSASLLKCIGKEDANYVLREVHERIYGNHIGARALVGKTLRQGYYWPTMLKDTTEIVRKCKNCQENAKISHLPTEPLTSIISPWPFQQWGLDILGPLPIGMGQCKFAIIGVNYFTKWAEAKPLATITEQKVRNFIWRSMICRFSIRKALISDNGKQFDNHKFKKFCAKLGIKNYCSSPAHLQSNGLAEVTIRTLKVALKTKLEDHKEKWVEYLLEVLWAYRTTRKSATRETLFALAFVTEAVAPIEVGLESPRVKFVNAKRNEETLRPNLDLLEEKREQALKCAED